MRISRKRFEEALKNKNTEKEGLLIARKQYALTRTDLIKKQHQLELSNLRGDKLVRKLQDAEAELKLVQEATDAQYSSEEVAMLKDLLQKNVKLQENRQITRSLILEELKHLGIDDTNFLAALDLQETQELVLSEDQKRLLANPDADGEFRFTDRALPEERKRAEQALNQRLNVHDKLGRSAYKKGHYLAAEEFFKINLDDHPGHIPSMLNLGVVRLRKAQSSSGSAEDLEGAITSFEDALAMRGDDGLPYALQMLGYAQYLQGNDQKATEHSLQCLSADPYNAKAHIFLGALMADQNDLKSSETHLRKALKISPTLTEPLYNLALLLINQGKYNEALQNYREALQKGAPSDPALEKQLRKALPQVSFQ